MTKARTLADNFAADISGITAGTGITGGGTSGTVTVTNSMATEIDAKGDLVVGTGADTFSRLAVASTAGYLLSVDSGETTGLKWAVDPVADVVTTAGDLIYGTAADTVARLGIGTAGQVLKVNSGATAPEWGASVSASPSFSLLNAGGTALTAASTITVSGISDKNYIMVLINGLKATSTAQLVFLRFNTDTGNNYTRLGPVYTSASTYAATNLSQAGDFDTDRYRVATTSGNANSAMDVGLFLQGGNTAGVKMIQASAGANAATSNGHTFTVSNGYYKGTSTISSVSVVTDSNFTAGTMYVYGA